MHIQRDVFQRFVPGQIEGHGATQGEKTAVHLRTGRTGLGTGCHIDRPQVGLGVALVKVFSDGQGVGDNPVLGLEQRHLAGGGERENALTGVGLVEFDQGFFVGNAGQLKGQGAA
ncbi:hypothetical protein D3C73_1232090 [compost metagenome]